MGVEGGGKGSAVGLWGWGGGGGEGKGCYLGFSDGAFMTASASQQSNLIWV